MRATAWLLFIHDHPDAPKIFGEILIKNADSRLFVAKKNGRNQVVAEFATTQAYKKNELRQNLPQFKKKSPEKLRAIKG